MILGVLGRIVAAALTLNCIVVSAQGSGTTWHGKSNASGGEVEHGYNVEPDHPSFDPELSESGRFAIRCDGFDRRLTLSFLGDHEAEGEAARTAIFVIDSDSYERQGDLGNGGLYPETPIIQTNSRDPLIAALMNGSQLKVFVGSKRGHPAFESDLNGTRNLMQRHLRACL